MAKQSDRKTNNTVTAPAFSITVWEASVTEAVRTAETSGVALTRLVREAAPFDLDREKAREVFQLAYGSVYAALNACTVEEATTSKTVRNRVSDCLCVLYAPAVVGEGDASLRVDALVGSIQTVAAKIRAATPKTPRQPRQPKTPQGKPDTDHQINGGEGEAVSGLGMLENALNVLKSQLGGNAKALELIGELVDLAGDLADALAAGEEDMAEAA